jgi:hypothetical protein
MRSRYWIAQFLAFLLLTLAGAAVPSTAVAQRTVAGTVVDADRNEPLPGVNVQVRGTRIGTTTSVEGEFTLEVPDGQQVLVFSFVGYRSREVPIEASQTEVRVGLQPDVMGMEEVVVTGLASSVKRENLANSIETVSAEELVGTTPSQTLDAALSGKVTGA